MRAAARADRPVPPREARELFTLELGGHPGPASAGEERASLDQVARWHLARELPRRCFRYRQARAMAKHLAWLPNPLKTALLLRVLARGACWLEDDSGTKKDVSATYLAGLCARWLADRLRAPLAIRRARRQVEALSLALSGRQPPRPGPDAPLYLRSDLVFDVEAGGAVAHISGVVNHLRFRGRRAVMVTTAPVPLVSPALEAHVLPPSPFRPSVDLLWRLEFNRHVHDQVLKLLDGRVPAFLYHRATAYCYAAAALAQDLGVPLVLEYNGSDAWISRHWGHRPLRHEPLAIAIEDLNLRAASLVVVVSQALGEEVAARGVPEGRILVVPNGADTDRYHPSVDGSGVRASLGAPPEAVVVGFVGTFGAWHGAEVLARAFRLVVARSPVPVHLLFVGDGSRLAATRALVEAAGLSGQVTFAGLVPQAEGPAYMAACDILVAPHVPNADGSVFFGSPTKLFEYLAMGKAVVASDLGQLGQVVEHGRNGLLVRPGDDQDLAAAITALVADPGLRRRLGDQARRDAVERYTWHQHAERIAARAEEVLGSG